MEMVGSFKKDKAETMHKVLAMFSLCVILVTVSYGVIMSIFKGVEVVGQTFVDVEFPPIHIFPIFYMKPISWLNLAIILLTYSGLELTEKKIVRSSMFQKSLIKGISFVVASFAVYEVLFNFTLWSGLIASDALLGRLNPDIIVNPFPNPQIPWNIVFATKIYLSITIVGAYIFYFVSRIERREHALP